MANIIRNPGTLNASTGPPAMPSLPPIDSPTTPDRSSIFATRNSLVNDWVDAEVRRQGLTLSNRELRDLKRAMRRYRDNIPYSDGGFIGRVPDDEFRQRFNHHMNEIRPVSEREMFESDRAHAERREDTHIARLFQQFRDEGMTDSAIQSIFGAGHSGQGAIMPSSSSGDEDGFDVNQMLRTLALALLAFSRMG